MDLNLQLGFGGNVFELHFPFPFFKGSGDKVPFDATVDKELVDAHELVAELIVVDIAFDGGQGGLQRLLNREQDD